jgi:hypothetical protein
MPPLPYWQGWLCFVATQRDLTNIQSVMDKAFADDPTVLRYSDAPEVQASEHHRYVELCAEPVFDLRGVHAIADFKGAAIRYPPGGGVVDADYEEFKQTAEVGKPGMPNMYPMVRQCALLRL